MPFSTKSLDKRHEREAARRQRVLDRRSAELEASAREKHRRQDAYEEAKAFAAELDAKAEKRRQLLNDLRAKSRKEKEYAARAARRTTIEDLITQVARRKESAHSAFRQQKEIEKEQAARRKLSQSRILQAVTELSPPHRDKQESREPSRTTSDPAPSKRRQEQHATRRVADMRSQQTTFREEERRRQDAMLVRQEINRDEARRHRIEDRRVRDAGSAKRLHRRAESAEMLRGEKKASEHNAESRRQRLNLQSKERADLEKRHERLLGLREQQLLDRRDREDSDALRHESLTAIRAQAVQAGRETRPAKDADPTKGRNNTPRKPVRSILVDSRRQSVLSASLPRLKVTGNSLVTLAGDRVILRGLTLTEWNSAGADIDRTIAAIAEWGATIIRIPLCQRRVTHDDGSYCRLLDRIISSAAAGGVYTSLALCTIDESSVYGSTPQGGPCLWPPMPGGGSIGMWRLLAQRYHDEPAVLFELFTAPHTALPDDVSGVDYYSESYATWCQMTIAELRSYAPAAVCLVAAAYYGTDITVLPIAGTANEPIPGVVYTVHAIPLRPLDWAALRSFSRTRPVLVSEWSGTENDLLWATRIAAELRGLGIGFCGGGAFVPSIYTQSGAGLVPTRIGMVVRRELARSEELAAPSVSIVSDSFFIQSFSAEGGTP